MRNGRWDSPHDPDHDRKTSIATDSGNDAPQTLCTTLIVMSWHWRATVSIARHAMARPAAALIASRSRHLATTSAGGAYGRELADRLMAGDRLALSKAITLGMPRGMSLSLSPCTSIAHPDNAHPNACIQIFEYTRTGAVSSIPITHSCVNVTTWHSRVDASRPPPRVGSDADSRARKTAHAIGSAER